jgi:hypothetical protein
MDDELFRLYKKYNYPSFAKFSQILKQNNVVVKNKEIKEFINKQSVNQLHKRTTKQKQMLKFIWAYEPYEMLQIDLLDYQKYSRINQGFKYVLIAVDVFTRFAYATPIPDKTPKSVLYGYKRFLRDTRTPELNEGQVYNLSKVNAIYHDSGNEFKGIFNSYLKDNNTYSLTADIGDHKSLGVIDAFSKSFKTMISKYMTANNTTKFYDAIDDLVEAYNSSPHSSINNIAPVDAFKGNNYLLIKSINREKMLHNMSVNNKQYLKIKVGDNVRIRIKKNIFNKGYEATYSDEVYKVISIKNNKATLNNDGTYKLTELLVVDKNAKSTPVNKERNKAENDARLKRRLNKEGLDYETEDDVDYFREE